MPAEHNHIRQFLRGEAFTGRLRGTDAHGDINIGRWVYLALWHRVPSSEDEAVLKHMLCAQVTDFPSYGQLRVARRQTLSSWSEKANGLLGLCGLNKIKHVCRGVWYPNDTPHHDPLLEEILPADKISTWGADFFVTPKLITPLASVDPTSVLTQIGIDLADDELRNLNAKLAKLDRLATQAELAMFVQTGCEHARHHFFKSSWPNLTNPLPLLADLKSTLTDDSAVSAYEDNAAILPAELPNDFKRMPDSHRWHTLETPELCLHSVFKAETHNHPTGIAPFPGAATGIGGEIRDEVATGRGATSRAGLAGYIVSYPHLSELPQSAVTSPAPSQLASAAQIMLEAPLGATSFGNEFGRPTVGGFCRAYEQNIAGAQLGFHKPVMFAAGCGIINGAHATKLKPNVNDLIVQLGGPGMRIGIGGGSAASGELDEQPSLVSVQRANADMQRRVQEVIDACQSDVDNPLRSLHDVGAGGLGNAVAELVAPDGCTLNLADIPIAQADLVDAEILCNESQERYVALIAPDRLNALCALCDRERCPLAVIGSVADHGRFVATCKNNTCVDLPMQDLLHTQSDCLDEVSLPIDVPLSATAAAELDITRACHRVLAHPAVADKSFLISIADRNVGGLTSRDQYVGPWQIAVADCAVIIGGYRNERGRVLALGERPPVAAHDPAAGARIAIAEALTNLAAAKIGALRHTALALNWLGNRRTPADRGKLITAVRAATKFVRELDIGVVSGKDSLAMSTTWKDKRGKPHRISAPACCIATATALTDQVRATLTPQLCGRTDTYLMHLGAGGSAGLGGSIYADCHDADGNDVPDIDAASLRRWWNTVQALHESGLLLAYHDISDGGLLACVCEMAFAGNCGATLVIDSLCQPATGLDADGYEMSKDAVAPGNLARIVKLLFCEAPGAVVEVDSKHAATVLDIAKQHRLPCPPQTVGRPNTRKRVSVLRNSQALMDEPLDNLTTSWTKLTRAITALRDHPGRAVDGFSEAAQLYATAHVSPLPIVGTAPTAVVLREQGTNGQVEMAAALDGAGFNVSIVSVAQLAAGLDLDTQLLVLPGGFSYGDTLGAGIGQSEVILRNRRLREMFSAHFAGAKLTLGVCNGCQTLSKLAKLWPIPCAMPEFLPNRSQVFEARLTQVEILLSASPFLAPLAGARIPVPLACGEGRVSLPQDRSSSAQIVPALRYITSDGLPALAYPANPCGAEQGLCGFASADGKVTLLMPHPERAVRPAQLSWCPPNWQKCTAWHDFFVNARNHLRQI